MNRGMVRGLLVLLLGWGLALGLAGRAAAQTGGLPTTRQPSSVRFDLAGTVGSGGQTITLSGQGAVAAADPPAAKFQMDLSLAVPGTSGQTSFNVIGLDGKTYLRMNIPGSTNTDQWYVMDMSTMGGTAGGMMPGMGAFDPQALTTLAKDAINVHALGKETINGTATTKYQADMDLQKFSSAMGSMVPQGAQLPAGGKLTIYLWIGDKDQYLHQMRMMMALTVPTGTGTPTQSVTMDLIMTFHDFDAPLTIAAPKNAVPLDLSGALPGGMGMPIAMPPTVGGAAPGMPRTGAGDSAAWGALLGLAGLCLVAGGLLRRAPVAAR